MSHRVFSRFPSLFLALSALWVQPLGAQRVIPDQTWCDEAQGGDSRAESFCEVREYSVSLRDLIRVDAEPNGGIRVEGWDRNEILLRATVAAWSRSRDPRTIVRDIDMETGGVIKAEGPDIGRRESWSISYRLMVPRSSDLEVESFNRNIQVVGVQGDMDLETMNGGIGLEDVGGNVRGRTTNGGLSVELSGSQWEGEGLDLLSANGGVDLCLPPDFRVTLETGTVNGGFYTDFPITVRGSLRPSNITMDLNGGGPRIRVKTTNGNVRIREG